MSQYGETNPHFWPELVPQHVEPEQVQPWVDHQFQPAGRIQPRHRPDPAYLPSSVVPVYSTNHQAEEPEIPMPLRPRYHGHLPQLPPPSRPTTRKHRPDEYFSTPQLHAVLPQPSLHNSERVQQHLQFPKSQPCIIPPPRHSQPHTGRQSDHYVGPSRGHNLVYLSPANTKPFTSFVAVFCVILWLVIILGGLIVLIIYLVYRPRNPHFEIPTAIFNSALIDYGDRLNADLTLLANFTNLNEEMNVDFNYVIFQLSYGKYHIATRYVEPFSALRTKPKLAQVEMISRQVQLPVEVSQQLMIQIHNNRVAFQVDGLFRARSNFGALLRYSYWLYGHCTIVMTGPPGGVMTASKCRTKR